MESATHRRDGVHRSGHRVECASAAKPARALHRAQDTPCRAEHTQPNRGVPIKKAFAVAPPRRHTQRQIRSAVEPFEPHGIALADVIGKTSVAGEDQGSRHESRHGQSRRHRGSRSSGADRGPADCDGDRHRRKHRHEESSRRARASPPHRKMRHREQIWDQHEQQLETQPALRVIAHHHDETRIRGDQHGSVREDAEALIEKQSRQAARNECRRSLLVRVRRGGIGRPVNRDEESDPAHGADGRDCEERDRFAGGVASRRQAKEHQRAEAGGDQYESRVNPRQHRQRRAVQPPRTKPVGTALGFPFGAQQRPDARECDDPARSVREHGEAVKDAACRQRDGRPTEPGGVGPPRDGPREVPRQRAADRRENDQKNKDAAIAGDRKSRRHESGKSRGMDRVDLSVSPAAGGSPASAALPHKRPCSLRCGGCSQSADRRPSTGFA